jgi:hypothetical protein
MKGKRAGHSWRPTGLANELYLELIRITKNGSTLGSCAILPEFER